MGYVLSDFSKSIKNYNKKDLSEKVNPTHSFPPKYIRIHSSSLTFPAKVNVTSTKLTAQLN